MSGEDLALETQLLLQGVTQLTHATAVDSEVQDSEKLLVSEYEAATDALLAKLRKKKAANRMQQQQLNKQRFGLPKASTMDQISSGFKNGPTKSKLPVTVAATVASRKKQQMVLQLKTQALQQGALQMAKLFGYKSHEEHVKHLNELDERKIRQDEVKERQEEGIEEEVEDKFGSVDVEDEEEGREETTQVEEGKEKEEEMKMGSAARGGVDGSVSETGVIRETDQLKSGSEDDQVAEEEDEETSGNVVRRRRRVSCLVKCREKDGNEADSEQDNQKDEVDDANDDIEDTMSAAEVMSDAIKGEQGTTKKDEGALVVAKEKAPADKAAGYRSLLRAEALQNRKRKRLMKSRGNAFVESEAEEDDEEDVLNIGGLGDFGFGVPQSKTQESKEAEEERRALVLREDDLDHIVDNLSDDEKAQEQDLDEMFRREREEMDRQQVKEVMRNVKEGFGRNRRAFSGLPSGSGARGRFNLDELVAADGSRFEAARLGLLESDEELSEDDDDKKKKKTKVNSIGEENGEEEVEEEIDEEADMERMLRERFLNQPKIYMTSSESGSDEEEEDAKNSGSDGDEIKSDEERERQQMKLFSERARINRRMQRMKDIQRQIALQDNGVDPTMKSDAAIPNILLEEDEESQELMHLLNRTNVDSIPSSQKAAGGGIQNTSRLNGSHRKPDRFTSYGGITSVSQTSSSFSRVIDQCQIFNANSVHAYCSLQAAAGRVTMAHLCIVLCCCSQANGAEPSKSFIFTSFSSDKKANDVNGDPDHDETKASASIEASKSKSRSDVKRMAKRHHALDSSTSAVRKKKRKSSGLFSVLSTYQCVSSTNPTGV
uniref:DNA replication checkpoint mediator MRC1 domain-containing protein n=1 Tax=Hyaloperonospora arabidopsidis (strain Emoy2) TaxID=559515 RepID=M4BM60_HYAAE